MDNTAAETDGTGAHGFTGIVVGVDGSPLSVEALRWGARLERAVGGPILAVTVWQYTSAAVMGSFPGQEWNPEADAREVIERCTTEAFGGRKPQGLTTTIISGPAAHVLLQQSRHARLLVLGSRGLGGFRGLLLGSVSAACAEHASCPVLVLHPAGGPET